MKTVTGGSCALLLALMMDRHALIARTPCESLSSLALPNTSITLAQMVPAGEFTLPGTGPAVPQFSQLPAFCRVAATLTPSSDSAIKIEVWLPARAWNGKFQAVGNGGWAGTITYAALASALQEGYATASTDTGHVGGNASFAIGHPEKVVDFAYRAVHEMAVKSKAVIAAFYDGAPRFWYWTGCSTGGRQALMEAQRYPEDFDRDYRRRSCEQSDAVVRLAARCGSEDASKSRRVLSRSPNSPLSIRQYLLLVTHSTE